MACLDEGEVQPPKWESKVPVMSSYFKVSGWSSKIAKVLVGAIYWLSASKPLETKVKVGGSE